MQLVAMAWCILWLVSCTWTMGATTGWISLIFLISYFWVEEILKNIVHVVAAGCVKVWWRTPGDGPTGGLEASLERALTTSFGSICYGSLLVNLFHGLRNGVNITYDKRERPGWNYLYTVFNFLFGYLRDTVTYLNKW